MWENPRYRLSQAGYGRQSLKRDVKGELSRGCSTAAVSAWTLMRYRRNNESRKGSWSPHSITCGHSVNLAAAFGPLACDICQLIWCEVWQGIRANTLPYLMPGLLVYKADSRIKDHHRRIARLTQLDPAKHDRADRLNMDQRIDHKTALAAIPDDERYIFIL